MLDVISYSKAKKVEEDLVAHKEEYAQQNIGEGIRIRELPNGVKDTINKDEIGRFSIIQKVSRLRVIKGADVLSREGPLVESYGHSFFVNLNEKITNKKDGYGKNYVGYMSDGRVFNSIANVLNDNSLVLYNLGSFRSGGFAISLSSEETGWTSTPSTPQVKEYFDNNPLYLLYELNEPLIVTPVNLSINSMELLRLSYEMQKNRNAIIELGGTI